MTALPLDRSQLEQAIAAGFRPKFLFFWGHTSRVAGVDKSCLSQWFPSPFEVDGERYATAEHWMMAGKARLFEDRSMLERILAAGSPAQAKQLGRQVKNFDAERWTAASFDIVAEGSRHKFEQNEAGSFLEHTGRRVLVEAAPRDRIWGIGMGQNNPAATTPLKWRGQNKLGFALMKARELLRSA